MSFDVVIHIAGSYSKGVSEGWGARTCGMKPHCKEIYEDFISWFLNPGLKTSILTPWERSARGNI